MHAATRIALALAAALLLAVPVADAAPREQRLFTTTEQYLAAMGDCATIDACIAAIDSVIDAGLGIDRDNDRLRERLLRFGDAAKHALMKKAMHGKRGWPNLAGDLLSGWPDLKPEDVPQLAQALARDPGGWVAGALGRIGTPQAIAVLIVVLDENNVQASYALARVGPKVLPSLFPLLEDDKRFRGAATVITHMGQAATIAAPDWTAIATDASQPPQRRLAALRGLQAMERHAGPFAAPLRPLLTSADPKLAAAALATLKAARDESAVEQIAAGCRAPSPMLDPYGGDACLWELGRFGDNARPAIPQVRRYLDSPNAGDRAAAITVLGLWQDRPSIPAFIKGLASPDWREVWTSARTLGWLGVAEARPALADVAANHWLPEVRQQAAAALAGLDSPEGHTRRPERLWDRGDDLPDDRFLRMLMPNPVDDLPTDVSCPGGFWFWDGHTIGAGRGGSTVVFDDGVMVGSDNGEWGGGLSWRPTVGSDQGLASQNVSGVVRAGDSAVVAFGLWHMMLNYGELMRFDRDGQGGWTMHPIGRLPAVSGAIMTLEDDLFAVHTRGRVVVFSSRKILGLATCAG